MSATSIDLSIIIVSWNVESFLAACLDTCLGSITSSQLNAEIIVVDSASSDGTLTMLKRYPQVKVLPQSENVGFTKGNNIGLAAASGRSLLLLNPDTEVIGDALGQMVAYLDTHSDVGIVGPHTLNSDRTTQSTRRRFPTFITALFESTWLQPIAPHRVLNRYYVRDVGDRDIADVDWVQGSALMARREVYEQIGGLDVSYIMYSEEMDWCKQARDAGWRVVYLGNAEIIHHGGKSTMQVSARSHIYFQQSKIRYFRKFHGVLAAFILRLYLILHYAIQLVIEAVKALIGHKATIRRERVNIYWQVIRSLTLNAS
jgi:N-acetylglucosaminyl-diphospho-decaprenol L-rhamnosyltransferase